MKTDKIAQPHLTIAVNRSCHGSDGRALVYTQVLGVETGGQENDSDFMDSLVKFLEDGPYNFTFFSE